MLSKRVVRFTRDILHYCIFDIIHYIIYFLDNMGYSSILDMFIILIYGVTLNII